MLVNLVIIVLCILSAEYSFAETLLGTYPDIEVTGTLMDEEEIVVDVAPNVSEEEFRKQLKEINSKLDKNQTVLNPYPVKPVSLCGTIDDFYPFDEPVFHSLPPPPPPPPPQPPKSSGSDPKIWQSDDLKFESPYDLWKSQNKNRWSRIGCDDFLETLDNYKWKGNDSKFSSPYGLWKWLKTNKWFNVRCEEFLKSLK